MTKTHSRAAILTLPVVLCALFVTSTAAQTVGFHESPPPDGVTITAYSGTPDELEDDGAALSLVSCFATVDGRFAGYVFGAPSFVNATFAGAFADGLSAEPLVCRRAAVDVAQGHPDTVTLDDIDADAIRRAVIERDVADLAGLAALESMPCGGNDTGDYPCPPGSQPGATFEMFMFVTCHGEPRFPAQLEEAFLTWFQPQGTLASPMEAHFYAAFETDDALRLVFVLANGEASWLDVLPDGRIDAAYRGCGPTSPMQVVEGISDFIVHPPSS